MSVWIWLLRLLRVGGLPDGGADSGRIAVRRLVMIFIGILVLRLGLWRLRLVWRGNRIPLVILKTAGVLVGHRQFRILA